MKRAMTGRAVGSVAHIGAARRDEPRPTRARRPAPRTSTSYRAGEDVADQAALLHADPLPPAPSAPPAEPLSARSSGDAAPTVGMTSPAEERLLSLRRLGRADWTLIIAVFGLCALGLLMVFSVSQAIVPNDPWNLLRHQALAAALGWLALIVAARFDYHRLRRLALPGLFVALALMLLTLIIGQAAHGAQRWLGGAISFQPSEVAKLALTLFLAAWFARVGPQIRTVRWGLLPFVGATGGLAALTLAQRDLGTTVVIVTLAFAIYFTAGARPAHLLALLGVGALCLGALALGVGYRRARILAFLDPLPPNCHDQASYQVCQGLLSLGSGGALGAGLGASVQKAGYLPLPQSDSIYAVLGGELGLLGCALVIGLLAVVVWRGYRVGRQAPDTFGALLACGVATWLGVQAAINIGGVVAAIPFTGVPLPFISYGGTALVCALAAVGALLNIHTQGAPLRRSRQPLDAEPPTDQQRASQGSENGEYAEIAQTFEGAHAAHDAQDIAAKAGRERARRPSKRWQRAHAGMPLATAGHTWTWSGRSLSAHRRGEEHL